jgi:hypothetical protein
MIVKTRAAFILMIPLFLLSITSSCSKKMITVIEQNTVNVENVQKHHHEMISDTSVHESNPLIEYIEPVSIDPGPKPDPLLQAENEASEAGKSVLEIGRIMAMEEKTIVKGSCWDYINEVFIRAGYGTDKTIVYKSDKKGPYVDVSEIKPGDWLYYINYSYYGIEHSGIFVYWKDFENKIGVTLSYGGEKRNEPGRYREYDLKSVYYITRPGRK